MHLGDQLFSSLDSPVRPVKKTAAWILIFLAIAMPITFRDLLMDFVKVETAKAQAQFTQMEQHIAQEYWTTPTTQTPGSGKQ